MARKFLSDSDNENSLMFHTMYAYTEAMGYPALLKLKIEELFYFSDEEAGVFQRDYILQNVEEESLSKLNRLSWPNRLKKDSSVISIADLLDLVKGDAEKYIPGKTAKNNNNGTKRALPKAEGDDMLARAYERGAGVKSQTGENSEANAAERDSCFPIDVIKTESPAPPDTIGGISAAERGLELSTNSIHQNKAIVNKFFLMAD